MTIRQKILEVFDLTTDAVSDERLLDLLIDDYHRRQRRINELETENAREREQLRQNLEDLQTERRNLHNDPLYGAAGEYYFVNAVGVSPPVGARQRLHVTVRGRHIEMLEQRGDYVIAIQQVSPAEWARK